MGFHVNRQRSCSREGVQGRKIEMVVMHVGIEYLPDLRQRIEGGARRAVQKKPPVDGGGALAPILSSSDFHAESPVVRPGTDITDVH